MANENNFAPMLDIQMGIDVFAMDWLYCDRLSTYIARMVSHNRTDSMLYANLLSSALNELLETVFRSHALTGQFSCRVLRDGVRDRVELRVPCDAVARAFFSETARLVSRNDIGDQYRNVLFSDGPLDPRIGLFELIVDYGARIAVAELGDGGMLLTADLRLEGNVEHA